MIGKLTLAVGLVAIGMLATPTDVSAAALPQTRLPTVDADMSMVQEVGHYRRHRHRHRIVRLHRHRVHRFVYLRAGGGYCSAWRHECAIRWGWQTRRYYRCLWRHGC